MFEKTKLGENTKKAFQSYPINHHNITLLYKN